MKTILEGHTIFVDKRDLQILNSHNWKVAKYKSGIKYLYCYINGKITLFQHLLINRKEKRCIDHVNGNGLDNRRNNLRACTYSENMMNKVKYKNNKSGYKGVYKVSGRNRWRSSLTVSGKKIEVGTFNTAVEAARAYDITAKLFFGEFSKLNFN